MLICRYTTLPTSPIQMFVNCSIWVVLTFLFFFSIMWAKFWQQTGALEHKLCAEHLHSMNLRWRHHSCWKICDDFRHDCSLRWRKCEVSLPQGKARQGRLNCLLGNLAADTGLIKSSNNLFSCFAWRSVHLHQGSDNIRIDSHFCSAHLTVVRLASEAQT